MQNCKHIEIYNMNYENDLMQMFWRAKGRAMKTFGAA